jgi:murein DD-endopeptidase MepM/ murein hydrolase activator NlpD
MRLLTSLVLALGLGLSGPAAHADLAPAPSRHGAWPLDPRPEVRSGFDPPATSWGAGHRGVDLAGRVGQGVHASLGGTVTFAARLAGRGVVVVDHGGVRMTYEPVGARVRVGDLVARGAVIGTLQRASSHCFPRACLHWGLRRGEGYLDPLTLVGAGPIRLLPFAPVDVSPPADASPWMPPSWSAASGTESVPLSRRAWLGPVRWS